MSILVGAAVGLVIGIGLIIQYWGTRNSPGAPSIWAPLFLGPACGAFFGLVVFLLIKV